MLQCLLNMRSFAYCRFNNYYHYYYNDYWIIIIIGPEGTGGPSLIIHFDFWSKFWNHFFEITFLKSLFWNHFFEEQLFWVNFILKADSMTTQQVVHESERISWIYLLVQQSNSFKNFVTKKVFTSYFTVCLLKWTTMTLKCFH